MTAPELPPEVLEAMTVAYYEAMGGPEPDDERAMLEALTALGGAGYTVEPDWRPIEEAPRDGTRVLVHGPIKANPRTGTPSGRTFTEVCPWWRSRWTITWMDGHGEPTHFRPLPAPPTGEPATEVCPECMGKPTYHVVSARDGAQPCPTCGGSGRVPA